MVKLRKVVLLACALSLGTVLAYAMTLWLDNGQSERVDERKAGQAVEGNADRPCPAPGTAVPEAGVPTLVPSKDGPKLAASPQYAQQPAAQAVYVDVETDPSGLEVELREE